MNRTFFIAFLLLQLFVQQLTAQSSYYSSIDGVKGGEPLKNALHELIKTHNKISYGSGENSTWWAFYVTDIVEGTKNQVADMYSSTLRYFGNRGASVSGMHIEHSVPKSWWGGGTNAAYYDLHHLNPSDATANQRKNNHPLGNLLNVSWTNGVSSIGSALVDGSSQTAFEPCDEYKGDFARAYMYIFTCYQNLEWEYTLMNYAKSSYPTLKPWAVELLLDWHRKDPVSQKEIRRNNAVYSIQYNRNPFIDYPNLADYIWGDSVAYTYSLKEEISGGDDAPSGGSYILLTNSTQLVPGSTIIIANDTNAMSTEQKTNNRGVASIVLNGNYIVEIADNVQTITLDKGALEGTYAFNVGGGYLCASSSDLNQLTTKSLLDANSSWKITIADDCTVSAVAQGNNSRKSLRYNKVSKLFSCYESGQQPLYIYIKLPETTAVEPVVDNLFVDVYSVSGVCVRRAVARDEAVKGLPPGVYIVNNQKILVK